MVSQQSFIYFLLLLLLVSNTGSEKQHKPRIYIIKFYLIIAYLFKMKPLQILLMALGPLLVLFVWESMACNEAVCASVVSKCQLNQACKCELKNCSCCANCFVCLGNLYDECCSCVEMCPKGEDDNSLSRKSHIEDFDGPIPDLFNSLMMGPDPENRWKVYTFPADIGTNPMYMPKYEPEIKLRPTNDDDFLSPKDVMNCTVAYLKNCLSWQKCRKSCQSTGASRFRWFHDGCCECVGPTCISYGSEKSLCSDCPVSKKIPISEEDKAAYYYDDEMDYTLHDQNLQHHSAENSHI